jgi:hypothetical protein
MQLVSLLLFFSLHMTLSTVRGILLFILLFNSHLCLGHVYDLTELELAEMSSCNLAESMHHKWNQQFGN